LGGVIKENVQKLLVARTEHTGSPAPPNLIGVSE